MPILCKSVKALQRYGRFRFFKMAAVRHLGFVIRVFGPPTKCILVVFVTLRFEFWLTGPYRQRNHPCQILWQSVQRFWSSDTPNFALLHRNSWSPLQQCKHYRATLWCAELLRRAGLSVAADTLVRLISMSDHLIVGPKCTLATDESCWVCKVSKKTGQTDRRTPDRYITLTASCSQ